MSYASPLIDRVTKYCSKQGHRSKGPNEEVRDIAGDILEESSPNCCDCAGPDSNQDSLFSEFAEPEWRKEWQGMPEFVQPRKREYAKLIIRFRNQKDLDDFARLIGQRLNRNSQCTWYPELQKGESGNSGKRYVIEP